MRVTRSVLVLFITWLLGASTVASAASITLTFDELPPQPVDGLTFAGVTFDFKIGGVDSLDAVYNRTGPGILTYVQDPVLEGNAAGVLTLDFVLPTSFLEFGAALSMDVPLTPGFSVDLYDAALAPLGSFPVDTAPLVLFSEGLFSHTGIPVSRAVVSFAPGVGRFALDNLTYGAIPEPGSLWLTGLGLAGLGLALRRARKKDGAETR